MTDVLQKLNSHRVVLVASIPNILFTLHQVRERRVDHHAHRRIIVGTAQIVQISGYSHIMLYIGRFEWVVIGV